MAQTNTIFKTIILQLKINKLKKITVATQKRKDWVKIKIELSAKEGREGGKDEAREE